MKTSPMLLSLTAALLALPAMAQAGAPPQQKSQKSQHFAIDANGAELGFVVIACSPAAELFEGEWLLTDGTIQLLQKQNDQFTLDLGATDLLAAGLYLQAVTYDSRRGLRLHAIETMTADGTAADSAGEQQARPADELAGEGENGGTEPAPSEQQLPLDLKLRPCDDGSCDLRLHARFLAPSDDYRLDLVRITQNDDGTADVYLFRKLPGANEGRRDVTEEHSVTADLFGSHTVAVFLFEGTERRVRPAADWKLLATLTQ